MIATPALLLQLTHVVHNGGAQARTEHLGLSTPDLPLVTRRWFTVAERKRAQSIPDRVLLLGTQGKQLEAQGRQLGE